LTFDDDPTGELCIPVMVVRGQQSGPTLWLEAGLHGDEYDGIVAILKWYERVSPEALSGTVIVVPVVNVSAFAHGMAASPIDHRNLNRVFPGNSQGTWSERFAAWLLRNIERHADAVLDLHGGGRSLDVEHFAFYAATLSLTQNPSLELAAATGVRYLCPQPATHKGTLYEILASHGIPAVIVEAGGGQSWQSEAVECHVTAILGILRALEMVDTPKGEVPRTPPERTRLISKLTELQASKGGIALRRVHAGATVLQDETLLELSDYHGRVCERIVCPLPKAIVLSAVSSAVVQPGEYVFLLGEPTT
jgi:predicted deacylase